MRQECILWYSYTETKIANFTRKTAQNGSRIWKGVHLAGEAGACVVVQALGLTPFAIFARYLKGTTESKLTALDRGSKISDFGPPVETYSIFLIRKERLQYRARLGSYPPTFWGYNPV